MDVKPRSVRQITHDDQFVALAEAALDRTPVTGWTHNFYRYPARFSPRFAAAAIENFSKPGDVVLDPYMGGGTAIVEGLAAGRSVIGNDLNSLAAFVTKVKVTPLSPVDVRAVRRWAAEQIPSFTYDRPLHELVAFMDPIKTKNMSLTKARYIKKCVAAALASIGTLYTRDAQDFARCALLKTGQWALDGRERHTRLKDFRDRLQTTTTEMLNALEALTAHANKAGGRAILVNGDAANIANAHVFRNNARRAALVVTSPPYPGVHVLYHRWQVDGRRETPAPYWIAGCNDGHGASFYNFGDRRETAADKYFNTSFSTLTAIRRVIRDRGYVVQMVAFNRPDDHLPRYLKNMQDAGFAEVSVGAEGRIWRHVPQRKWHASLQGKTHSANEVVLVHRAI